MINEQLTDGLAKNLFFLLSALTVTDYFLRVVCKMQYLPDYVFLGLQHIH